MPAAMNGVVAKNGEARSKLDSGQSAHGCSADLIARFPSTCPAGPRHARAHGIRRAIFLFGALGAAWSGVALASDGVLEINQTCAVQTGCFAGDTAGLPVTINGSAGKSYRLTSDLAIPNENTSGIAVGSDDVGIDLNNFTIRGPVICSGVPPECVPNTGSGTGVTVTSVVFSGISVRNGSIRGMGGAGVELSVHSEVTNLRVRSNRAAGILAGTGSTLSGNTTSQNGGHGIEVNNGSTVSGNTAYLNVNNGIFAGAGSTVSGNTTSQNGDHGIEANLGSTVWGNTAYLNGNNGISAGPESAVWGNTVSQNTGFGLNLGVKAGYRENVISNNGAGTVTGGVNAGGNVCNGVLCP